MTPPVALNPMVTVVLIYSGNRGALVVEIIEEDVLESPEVGAETEVVSDPSADEVGDEMKVVDDSDVDPTFVVESYVVNEPDVPVDSKLVVSIDVVSKSGVDEVGAEIKVLNDPDVDPAFVVESYVVKSDVPVDSDPVRIDVASESEVKGVASVVTR